MTVIRARLVAAALALGLFVAPLVGEGEPARRLSRVGILAAGSAEEAPNVAFFDRMRELGYVEGQTVVFDRRFAAGKIEQLPTFAAQIVAANPDVIFAPVTIIRYRGAAERCSRAMAAQSPVGSSAR